ncbi:MAG TPA: phosphoribosylanthranilate isomerase [Longimicrobiales bacterium]|nr:phosphoribosylanthranilate isomerase [Longimicrobiales bacterium]
MAERVRVKICGLVRREDALVADRAGADYLGVILSPGFGRSVNPTDAAHIVSGTRARKVAVLVDETAEAAEAAAVTLGADVLQLHGAEDPSVLRELRARGSWRIWKAVLARSIFDVERTVERYAGLADGILVEGWKEGGPGRGGARLTLEPDRVRSSIPRSLDFVLAGGLDAETVSEAVASFGPEVVDVSSGVERSVGVKEHDVVRTFIDAARGLDVASAPRVPESPAPGRAR